MEFEEKLCPVIKVDGNIENGTQFDISITLPEDNRNVIYGIVKDIYKEPIENAIVKLIEIDFEHGKKIRKPVSHTFTDKEGEFVFGPLCPDKKYDIQIWVNKVKHIKTCFECHKEKKCLKAMESKPCEFYIGKKEDLEECKKNYISSIKNNFEKTL